MSCTQLSLPLASFDLGCSSTIYFQKKKDTLSQNAREGGYIHQTSGEGPQIQTSETLITDVLDTSQPVDQPKRFFFPSHHLGDFVWNSVTSIGKGLDNVANTCFLNATVQALVYCAPFAQDCLNGCHAARCVRKEKKQLCGFCFFERHVRELLIHQKGQGNVFSWNPTFLQLMKKEIRMNQGYGNWYGAQNCAHEWFVQFLDFLVKYDLPTELQNDFHHGRIPYSDLSTTYLHQLFSGLIEESKICCFCHRRTTRYELNTCFKLPLSKTQSVEKAFKISFDPELLTGSNQPLCEGCGVLRDKKACRAIHRPPNVLVVLLQRTQFHCHVTPRAYHNRAISKNNVQMDIALTLTLDAYMTPGFKESYPSCKNEYNFIASVNHSGTAGFGHYWTVVKGPDGQYYKFDDEHRSRVPPSSIRDHLASAYLLFYLRKKPFYATTSPQQNPSNAAPCSPFQLKLYADILARGRPKSDLVSCNVYNGPYKNKHSIGKAPNAAVSCRSDVHYSYQKDDPGLKRSYAQCLCKKRSLRLSYRLRRAGIYAGLLKGHRAKEPVKAAVSSMSLNDAPREQYTPNKHFGSPTSEESFSQQSPATDDVCYNVVISESPSEFKTRAIHRWEPFDVSAHAQKAKEVTSQYGYCANPVCLWESDTEEKEYQTRKAANTRHIRESIQKSLLPKTARRTEEDMSYDIGKQKKIKAEKSIQPFDFGSALLSMAEQKTKGTKHNKTKKRRRM